MSNNSSAKCYQENRDYKKQRKKRKKKQQHGHKRNKRTIRR